MALDIMRPNPWSKRGDQAVPLAPHHYVTLFYGIPRTMLVDDKQVPVYKKEGIPLVDTQRLYVGDGAVYEDPSKALSLKEVDEQFPWFWGEYAKISPEVRAIVGVMLPAEQAKSAAELSDAFITQFESLPESVLAELASKYAPKIAVVEEKKMFVCDICGEEMATTLKGVHMSHHKKRGESTN